MICVLNVVEGPATGMRCWLRHDQTLQIGRIATADFSVPNDLQMSRNHLVVEGCGESFRVRDVGSSNGTFVNSSKIKVMELCTGDRIRAGNSIFSVSFQADGQVVPVVPTSKAPPAAREPGLDELTHRITSSQKAPFRTVDALGSDMDANVLDEAEFSGDAAENASMKVASSEITEIIRESSGVELDPPNKLGPPDKAEEQAERVLGGDKSFHGQWWKSCFAPTDQPGLYLDTFSRTKGQKPSIPDLLMLAESNCELVLVVNSGQLNTANKNLLDFVVGQGGAEPISETLFLLTRHSSVGVRAFLDRCAQQDAAVCFGLPKNSTNGYRWIRSAVEFLSYPSMFYSIVRDEQSQLLSQVIKNVSFAVFEKSPTGAWCLLMNPN